MIVLKYEKTYPSSMVSHIDTVRLMNRIIRRSGIDIAYSAGFNPHMEIFFSPALSLGVESVCEMMAIKQPSDIEAQTKPLSNATAKSTIEISSAESQIEVNASKDCAEEAHSILHGHNADAINTNTGIINDAQSILQRLNAVTVDGIRFTACWIKEKNPNFAAHVYYASYLFCLEGIGSLKIDDITKGEYFIEYIEKGTLIKKDISDLVKFVEVRDKDCIEATLACGNKNLKADRFICGVCANNGINAEGVKIVKQKMFDEQLNEITVALL
ncbi:MAG: TIGR03936 family radical SAM-associated protein [Clostridia bacterium]|nr:TIGR03936 family radical SAM-associated protein [Clostridia bacterium]